MDKKLLTKPFSIGVTTLIGWIFFILGAIFGGLNTSRDEGGAYYYFVILFLISFLFSIVFALSAFSSVMIELFTKGAFKFYYITSILLFLVWLAILSVFMGVFG